jgi:hypothetical protein
MGFNIGDIQEELDLKKQYEEPVILFFFNLILF